MLPSKEQVMADLQFVFKSLMMNTQLHRVVHLQGSSDYF